MGPGSSLDSGGMIGFAGLWVATCVFLIIPVPKMTPLVYAKLIVFIISAVATLGWTVGKAGGLGPIARQGSTVSGAEKTWLVLRLLMLGTAPDFQRYARKPFDVIRGNLIGFPIANFIVALVGNLGCASSQIIYRKLIWNPVTLPDRIQTENYTAANRAGCFFIALMFASCAIFPFHL
jgi:NCS1 family nucleobase:cation symporter-1